MHAQSQEVYEIWPQSTILTSCFGVPDFEPTASIACNTSKPSWTCPNTMCFLSSHGVLLCKGRIGSHWKSQGRPLQTLDPCHYAHDIMKQTSHIRFLPISNTPRKGTSRLSIPEIEIEFHLSGRRWCRTIHVIKTFHEGSCCFRLFSFL